MTGDAAECMDDLEGLEEALARDPGSIDLRFRYAGLLAARGRLVEARQEYVDILHRDSAHVESLNEVGTLLLESGFIRAACTAYVHALNVRPDNPVVHVNLANLYLSQNEFGPARSHFEQALKLDNGLHEAHRGLSHVLLATGDEAGARRHRDLGYAGLPLAIFPYRGTGAARRALVLASAAGGNIPFRHILEDRLYHTTVLFSEYINPAAALPPHDLVVNIIGDADRCAEGLDAAEVLAARSSAPVINPPARIRATGRIANARQLGGLPGVVAPRIAIWPRERLAAPEAVAELAGLGIGFPLLLRSPGYHTGMHFVRVDDADALPGAVAGLPGADLLAIEYLDARGADGASRKYRVMMVNGRLLPLHLAMSNNWKVHYFTADMNGRPQHQAEEDAFLADMAGVLGPQAMTSLAAIRDTLALDYGGIDFALDGAGRVLLFEANATMIVVPPGEAETRPHRRAAALRILDEARTMLADRGAGRISL